jgi:hypothetical protein
MEEMIMSGYKYSQIALKKEKELKIYFKNGIQHASGRLNGLAAAIDDTLNQAPEGIKKTFEQEVNNAKKWQEEVNEVGKNSIRMSMSMPIAKLRKIHTHVQSLVSRGEILLDTLVTCFNRRADQMEKSLVCKLSRLESMRAGYKEVLQTWIEQKVLQENKDIVEKARQLLKEKQLKDAEEQVKMAEKRIHAAVEEARDLEEKQEKRVYVLKALRQVCTDMGFEEMSPEYGEKGKKGPIVYEVDTLDQGKIRFFLSLDSIKTFSQLPDNTCPDEFDKVSKYLEEEFGVKTKFRPEEEKADQKLIQKGEMDLPEEGNVETTYS